MFQAFWRNYLTKITFVFKGCFLHENVCLFGKSVHRSKIKRLKFINRLKLVFFFIEIVRKFHRKQANKKKFFCISPLIKRISHKTTYFGLSFMLTKFFMPFYIMEVEGHIKQNNTRKNSYKPFHINKCQKLELFHDWKDDSFCFNFYFFQWIEFKNTYTKSSKFISCSLSVSTTLAVLRLYQVVRPTLGAKIIGHIKISIPLI